MHTRPIPVSTFTGRDYFFVFVFLTLVGVFFYVIGLGVFYVKPNLTAARAFLFVCFIAGITLAATTRL